MAVPTLLPAVHISGGVSIPEAVVYTTTLTSSADAGIWSVGGDWVYDTDETNSQSGTADNWLMMVAPYNTNYYATTPISYNTTTHTFTELAADWQMYNLGSSSHSGSGQQLSLDRGVWGMRSAAASFTARMYFNDLAANLGSFDNNVNTVSPVQRYGGGFRVNDTQGLYGANSNAQLFYMGTYSGGASTTTSASSGESAAFYHAEISSPGGGSEYANLGTTNEFLFINHADSITFNDATTRVDINHMSWTGAASGALTRTDNDSAVTLPTHTGSTERPRLLATTWGNVLIHSDTANPANSVVYPITWSGGTATVGSSVAFDGGTDVPAGQCFWQGLDGIRYAGNYPKYSCGQDRSGSNPDLYRTVRLYTSGSDIAMDTITVDFSNSNGSHTVTVKQEAVHTFTSTSSTAVWPVFMANNTDLGIWHQDTAEWAYIENAYY